MAPTKCHVNIVILTKMFRATELIQAMSLILANKKKAHQLDFRYKIRSNTFLFLNIRNIVNSPIKCTVNMLCAFYSFNFCFWSVLFCDYLGLAYTHCSLQMKKQKQHEINKGNQTARSGLTVRGIKPQRT